MTFLSRRQLNEALAVAAFTVDEPTIGDICSLLDHVFLSGAPLWCYEEADINQSGGDNPYREHLTIGDISTLVDYLFITGPTLGLPDCL